jgi:hypothetical protein
MLLYTYLYEYACFTLIDTYICVCMLVACIDSSVISLYRLVHIEILAVCHLDYL